MNNLTQTPHQEPTVTPWVEKQFARALDAIEVDRSGLLFDRDVREHIRRADPPADVAGSEALAALRSASHALRTTMDRWLDGHGLSEGRLSVLWRLQGEGSTTLGELAASLDVSPRNITGLIDHLEEDQLVERFPDPDDRRATRVRLTPAGERKLRDVQAEKVTARTTILAGFVEDDLNQLRHLCLKLVRNLAQGKKEKEKE